MVHPLPANARLRHDRLRGAPENKRCEQLIVGHLGKRRRVQIDSSKVRKSAGFDDAFGSFVKELKC